MGQAIAVDDTGNIFVTGFTRGALDGNPNIGGDCDPYTAGVQPCNDAFLTKWNADGSKEWTRQWGSDKADIASDVVVNPDGNLFVIGHTQGALDDNTSSGGYDVFLTKWNTDGTKAWTKQWGSSSSDISQSIAVDGDGNIFVSGYTGGDLDGNTLVGGEDLFLTKFLAE